MVKEIGRFFKKYQPFLLLFILLIIFFYKNIFKGEYFYFGDNYNLFIPNKIFFKEQIFKGIFPLWNPLIFSGTPYLADLGIFPLYPGNIFFLIFSPPKALTYLSIFQVYLLAVFSYLYFYVKFTKKSLSLIAAIILAFSGSVISHIGNLSILNVITWFPLILLFLERYCKQRRFLDLFFLGLFMTVSFLGGHLQIFYYNLVFIILYILFNIRIDVKYKIKTILLLLLLFLSFSAIQMIPFIEFANLSTRPLNDFSYSSIGSMPPVTVIRLFFAQIFGRLIDGYSWGPQAPMERGYADVTGYIGIIPLLIIFWKGKKYYKKIKFWLISAFLLLIISFGKYTPLYYVLFKTFPFFSRFRNPSQFLFLYGFCAVYLTIYLLSRMIWDKKQIFRNKRKNFLYLFSGPLFFSVFLYFRFYQSPSSVITKVYQTIFNRPIVFPGYYSPEKVNIIILLFLENIYIISFIIGIFLYLYYLFKRSRISRKLFLAFLAILIFIDLFIFSKNSLYSASIEAYRAPEEAASYLKTRLSGQRFISAGEIVPYTGLFNYWNQLMVRPPFGESRIGPKEEKNYSVLKKEISVLPPNIGMNYNFATVNGYGSMILKSYADLFREPALNKKNINYLEIDNLFDRKIYDLGVEYLVIDKDLMDINSELQANSDFQLVFTGAFVKIYRYKLSKPRIYLEASGKIIKKENLSEDPNRIVINLGKSQTGKLFVSDAYYPGWKVYLNEQPIQIAKTKNGLRQIDVFQNTGGQVIVKYEPVSLIIGFVVSIISFLLCSLKLALSSVLKTRRK